MLSLLKKKKKSDETPTVSVKNIPPRSNLLIGRHFAFSIDDTSIQIAVSTHLANKVRIVAADKQYLPLKSESPERWANAVESSISAFTREYRGINSSVTVALTGRDTAFRTFRLPSLSRKELDSAVGYEVRNQVPFPKNDCCYDYQRLRVTKTADKEIAEIALYASTHSKIMEQLAPFDAPGVGVDKVIHSQEALGHLLRRLPDFRDDEIYCLLSITRGYSEISFFEGSRLKFFHSGAMGSAFSSGGLYDPATLQFFAQSLINEVRTSFDFFTGNFNSGGTPTILVYGDLSYSTELLKLLRDGTTYDFQPFPTAKLDCLENIEEETANSFTACLPALAASVCQKQTSNLLPPVFQETIKAKHSARVGKLVLGTTVLMLAAASWTMYSRMNHSETDAALMERKVTEFEQSAAYHTYNNIKLAIIQQQKYLAQSRPYESNVWLALKDLSLLTPNEIELQSFSYQPKLDERNVTMQGAVVSDDIPPELILAEFAEDIMSSPIWEDVQIVRYTKRAVKKGYELQFVMEMRGKA